jgi:hypothetical protein
MVIEKRMCVCVLRRQFYASVVALVSNKTHARYGIHCKSSAARIRGHGIVIFFAPLAAMSCQGRPFFSANILICAGAVPTTYIWCKRCLQCYVLYAR